MTTPQIEMDLDGKRQPVPGRLKRLIIKENWEWTQALNGQYGLAGRDRDIEIEVWGTAEELSALGRFADRTRPYAWISRPGYPTISVIIVEARLTFTGTANGDYLALRGRALSLDLINEERATPTGAGSLADVQHRMEGT